MFARLELVIEDVLFRSPRCPSRTPLVRYTAVQLHTIKLPVPAQQCV